MLLAGMCGMGTPVAAWPQAAQPVPPASDQKQDQSIPDAPSASRPPQPLPSNPPPGTGPQSRPASQPPAAGSPSPTDSRGDSSPSPPTDIDGANPTPRPSSEVKTVPAGASPHDAGSAREQLYKFVRTVNFVLVPVTVKDESGRLVDGLLRKDFAVYEEGVKQNITVFTSDPFPLSAAVILDTGMPDVALRKVNQTFPALQAAFGQFDEVSLYTYGNTVKKVLDFSGLNQRLDVVLRDLKENEHGTSGGVPVISGPINSGPTINGRPADPGAVVMNTPVIPSHVLNDAVLTAALDLSKRDPTRRKVIFIISDGHDWGSSARYNDVLKMLLSRNIAVYAVGVDSAAIPGYNTLEKIRLPRFGSSNILPKYASATGGHVFAEFSRQAIESAYAQLTRQARNQYTIGYNTRATPSSTYRTIDVRVLRGGLKVYAKDGYYPLPPPR